VDEVLPVDLFEPGQAVSSGPTPPGGRTRGARAVVLPPPRYKPERAAARRTERASAAARGRTSSPAGRVAAECQASASPSADCADSRRPAGTTAPPDRTSETSARAPRQGPPSRDRSARPGAKDPSTWPGLPVPHRESTAPAPRFLPNFFVLPNRCSAPCRPFPNLTLLIFLLIPSIQSLIPVPSIHSTPDSCFFVSPMVTSDSFPFDPISPPPFLTTLTRR